MDRMYAVDGQKHAWAGHSCGAVKDNALLFPYASPSGKAEGSADISLIQYNTYFTYCIYDMMKDNYSLSSPFKVSTSLTIHSLSMQSCACLWTGNG